VRWRLTGVEQAAAEPSLPFFIEWGRGRHSQDALQRPIQPVTSRSFSYDSTGTPVASLPGSGLTVSRSSSAQVRPPSRASSSPALRARSSSPPMGCKANGTIVRCGLDATCGKEYGYPYVWDRAWLV
jgi:hypothetical protein